MEAFEVQAAQCKTCIYRKNSHFDVPNLEAQIADKHMEGYFGGFRICHHSKTACCRGFWNRHKDKFTMGQLAQRLGWVTFVTHDTRKDL